MAWQGSLSGRGPHKASDKQWLFDSGTYGKVRLPWWSSLPSHLLIDVSWCFGWGFYYATLCNRSATTIIDSHGQTVIPQTTDHGASGFEDHYGTFMNASYTFFEITFSGGRRKMMPHFWQSFWHINLENIWCIQSIYIYTYIDVYIYNIYAHTYM